MLNQVTYSTTSTTTIDTEPPTGGSINYHDGFSTTTSVDITLQDGTDASEIATTTRTLQRKSATLSDGSCGSYSSWSTVATSSGVGYPIHTDSNLSTNQCYKYQYLVEDEWGHTVTYGTSSVLQIDAAAPTGLDSLNVENTGPDWVELSWQEVTEANFDHYEIWYGTSSNAVASRTAPATEWSTTSISVADTTTGGLNASTTYYFKIWAVDHWQRESTVSMNSAETVGGNFMDINNLEFEDIELKHE